MSHEDKRQELARLRLKVLELENELDQAIGVPGFRPTGFYTAYYATTGFLLGIFGAISSLLFNVVGSVLVGQHPLELIRVYLTFPLGDQALEMQSGLALAIGCCLYLGTGMLLGIPFYLALVGWTGNRSFGARLLLASALALAIWIINYYCVLSWLQPALIDMSPQNLIVNRIPPWVAALTHLVYGWTMVLVYPLGQYSPYQRVTEQS